MPEKNRTPAIIGFLVAGALILTFGFLAGLRNGSDDMDGVPALRVQAPAPGDTVENPVRVLFTTPAPLELGPMGWAASDLHLHIMVDGTEHMPAAGDIESADGTFTWTLPPLDPGDRTFHLTWAGRHHGNLRGVTDTVTVTVLP